MNQNVTKSQESKKKYLIRYILLDIMNIRLMPFNKLKEAEEQVIYKLGEIEAYLNYNKQKKWKTNVEAQSNIIMLKDSKKYWMKIKEEIDNRLAKGY